MYKYTVGQRGDAGQSTDQDSCSTTVRPQVLPLTSDSTASQTKGRQISFKLILHSRLIAATGTPHGDKVSLAASPVSCEHW